MTEEKLYVAMIGNASEVIQTPTEFIDINWIKEQLFDPDEEAYIEVVRNCFFRSSCLIICDESGAIHNKPKTICTPRRGIIHGNIMICGEALDNHLERDLCGIPIRELELAVKQCIQLLQPNKLLMGKDLWNAIKP